MVKKQSISHLSLNPQRKACKPRVPDAHTYSHEARIAKRFRYCRNYAHETQKRPGMDAGARRTAPWTARFDGFVKHRKSKSIISYRILVAKRSESESACLPIRPRLTYRPAINAQKLRTKTRTQNLFCEKCLKTKVKKCRNCTLT